MGEYVGYGVTLITLLFGAFKAGQIRKGKAEATGEELKNQNGAIDLYDKMVVRLNERDDKIAELTKLVQDVSDQNIELLKTSAQKDTAIEKMGEKLEKVHAQNKQFLTQLKKLQTDYDRLVKLRESQNIQNDKGED